MSNAQPQPRTGVRTPEEIYHDWDKALGRKDVAAAMTLYAPDATLESPLVCHLLGIENGVLRGRDEIRRFATLVFERQPPQRQRYKRKYFTDGETLMWEYPRGTPEGEQMDFVEVMELKDGFIQHHRVYWGWLGVGILSRDQHRAAED
jgi:SnoaL-like domain